MWKNFKKRFEKRGNIFFLCSLLHCLSCIHFLCQLFLRYILLSIDDFSHLCSSRRPGLSHSAFNSIPLSLTVHGYILLERICCMCHSIPSSVSLWLDLSVLHFSSNLHAEREGRTVGDRDGHLQASSSSCSFLVF